MNDGPVLLVSSLYEPLDVGGAERVVRDLAGGLLARDLRCVVATLNDGSRPAIEERDGVEVRRLPVRNVGWPFDGAERSASRRARWHLADAWNPMAARDFGRLLDEVGPRLVNTHTIAGFSVAIWREAARRRIPLVHTMHDQYLMCPRTTMFRDDANCVRQCGGCRLLAAPRLLERDRPALVTGPSRFILDRHRRHGWFAETPQRVVPNAVSRLTTTRGGAADADRPFRFGFLGRIAATKGIERLLAAFDGLDDRAELLIGGTGEHELERRLRAETAGDDRVSWLGHVDAGTFLDEIDVLVVPSTWDDTAPLVVMEAFQCGVPVVGADRGGIPELVEVGAGWIVDPDDRHAFAACLRDCVATRDRIPAMGEAARAAAELRTIDRMAGDYLAAFELVS